MTINKIEKKLKKATKNVYSEVPLVRFEEMMVGVKEYCRSIYQNKANNEVDKACLIISKELIKQTKEKNETICFNKWKVKETLKKLAETRKEVRPFIRAYSSVFTKLLFPELTAEEKEAKEQMLWVLKDAYTRLGVMTNKPSINGIDKDK